MSSHGGGTILPVDTEKVYAVSIHPGQQLVAFGAESSCVKLFNLETNTYLPVLPQVGRVYALSFSPCGNYLATCASSPSQESFRISLWSIEEDQYSEDGAIHFRLELDDTAIADTLELAGPDKLHQGDITTVAFRPPMGEQADVPCSVLASGSRDQTVRLWQFSDIDEEISDGFEMRREIFRHHNGEVYSVAFSDDGRVMATGGADRRLIIWKFYESPGISVFQMVTFDLDGESPYSLDFLHSHQGYQNMNDVLVRDWRLMCGTDVGFKLLEARNTYVKADVGPAEMSTHVEHDDRERRRIGPRAGPLQGTKSVASFQRNNTQFIERRMQEKKEEVDNMNFLLVHMLQEVQVPGGVRTVKTRFYAADQRGAFVVVTGGVRGVVSAHMLSPTRSNSIVPYVVSSGVVAQHEGPVVSLDIPVWFDGEEDRNDMFMVVSASTDETARRSFFYVDHTDTGMFSIGDDPDKLPDRPPLLLERPMTEQRTAELFGLREEIRKADLEIKGQAAERGRPGGKAPKGAPGALEAFNVTAMIKGGVVPRNHSGIVVYPPTMEDGDAAGAAAVEEEENQATAGASGAGAAAVAATGGATAPRSGGRQGTSGQPGVLRKVGGTGGKQDYQLRAGSSKLVNFEQLADRQYRSSGATDKSRVCGVGGGSSARQPHSSSGSCRVM